MRVKIKQWFAGCAVLLAGSLLATSCHMMEDDLEECPNGLYLSFKYDYNLQRADMFNDHVGAVTVYVFDEDGRYVTKREEANRYGNEPLRSSLYTMHITGLAPGRYKFLVLAGQKSYEEMMAAPGAKFVRHEPQAGSRMEGGLSVDLQRMASGDGTFSVDNGGVPLDTLWHGMTSDPVEVYDISRNKAAYDTVSLVRDTKKINVTLRELDHPETTDVADYDFKIIDRNARILWDNSVDETDVLVYTPHAVWNSDDRTPSYDGEGRPIEGVGHIAHADFMTSRILWHDNPAEDGILSVTNRQTGIENVRVNLPDLLSRLRRYEDIYRYSPQEFLDRGYDYQLDFFLKDGKLAYCTVAISILNWSMRVQFEALH